MMKKTASADSCCPKGAGRPKACDVHARVQDLITTAGNLFLKHGYGKVSLEMIARQAHVAVRTIYVKFGGKVGLLEAVLRDRRDRLLNVGDMATDPRPFKVIVEEFARHFIELLGAPETMAIHRVVIAEARDNPELAQMFYDAGPGRTYEMLQRFFARPDVRAQLREDLPFDFLPVHLTNCIAGDQYKRFLIIPAGDAREAMQRGLSQRLELFYTSVLR